MSGRAPTVRTPVGSPVVGLQVQECKDGESIWVEIVGRRGRRWELAPDAARRLAARLTTAADQAEAKDQARAESRAWIVATTRARDLSKEGS